MSIYNDDCVIILKSMADESINLCVSDFPYLINHKSNRRTKLLKFSEIENDTRNEFGEHMLDISFKEIYRVLTNNSHIYVFCSWHNVDLFKSIMQQYFKIKNILIWDKGNHGSGDLKGAYGNRYEFVLFGHKGRRKLNGKRIPDIITDYPKIHTTKLLHPHQKPIELLELFIEKSSDVGDIVLDPYCGVGSTLKAAQNLNRQFIGIEIDKHYYKLAKELTSTS